MPTYGGDMRRGILPILRKILATQRRPIWSAAIATSALLVASQALAGTLTIVGSQTVSTNLTAQSITLGGVTQTNWPSMSAGGAIDLTDGVIDFSQTGLLYRITLTNNISWVFTNHVAGRVVLLQITEGGSGGWTNSWPSGLLWQGGQIINSSSASNDVSVYEILDNGSTWLAQAQGLDYAPPCTSDCSALRFAGSNYITVDQGSQWQPATFTFEAWVKSSQGQPNGGYGALASTMEFGGATPGWLAAFTDAGHFFFGGRMSDYSALGVEGTVAINDGAWHHVAATYDGTNLVTYVDGVQDTGPTSATGGLGADWTLNFGVLPGGGYNYYGVLDEVRISKTVRYPGSFTPAYHPTADSDTIGLWTFSEGSGTTAGDATGNHGGTLGGSPTPAWVAGR